VGEELDVIVIEFDLNAFDPIVTISGIQARPCNIGYF
jgi:hypothetical protein